MKRTALRLLLVCVTILPVTGADYRGKVGKLEAVFSLEWHDDGSVSGAYAYPSKPGTVYGLAGSNPAEGELYLEEYTGDTLTARCALKKTVTNGVIVWRGEMHNTDGRVLEMEFARARAENTTAPAPVSPAAAETTYSGYVGRLEAEFQLSWLEDGTVSGSYHYPKRPGTFYGIYGVNPAEGELFLAEYTGERLTASCALRKRLEADVIIWEGIMMNEDGRHFPMAFARARGTATAAGTIDDYEAKRQALFSSIGESARWDDFPLADEVIERVPVHLDGGEYFGARILAWDSDGIGTTIRLIVADWDNDGNLLVDEERELTLRVARVLPLAKEHLVGREVSLLFAADGSLYSLELPDIAITHVRRSPTGKLEVRGVIDLSTAEDSFDWTPERFAEKMRTAPVIDFIPDKLALHLEPARDLELAEGEVFFQTIRFVRDHGIAIQATSAGPGSLELESLSLSPEPEPVPWIALAPEPEPVPWIALEGLKEPVKAPPSQFTTQAG